MRYNFFLFFVFFILATTCFSNNSFTAKEIIEKADKVSRAPYEILNIQMTLFNQNLQTNKREIIWYLKDNQGYQISLLKFLSPANVRDEGILVEDQKDRTNLIWEYTPETRNIRRIPGEHKQNRFMGTEMIYEDFEGFKINQSNYKLLKIMPYDKNHQCYVIEATPANLNEQQLSSYSKKIYFIDAEHYYLLKSYLYDKNQQLFKIYELQTYNNIDGYWRPERYVMSNLQTHNKTEMRVMSRKMNSEFNSYYVSQRYLRSE
jgi:hypothetical protein